MARRTIVAGPPGGGKSQWVLARLAEEPDAVQIDFTALFAAFAGQDRDEQGRFPIRENGDQRLGTVALVRLTTIRTLTLAEKPFYVTTASPEHRDELRTIADTDDVVTLDPGRAVVTERLRRKYDGELPVQCEEALTKWYGPDD